MDGPRPVVPHSVEAVGAHPTVARAATAVAGAVAEAADRAVARAVAAGAVARRAESA
ncbi:hypothetical protein M5362_17410 [Streptomyces sp. Je 1-79]|uniref:hypothetical protein n=1 Tax=Streptomyces sp. Je 1-79 TaxID=2943847 RepID=UPI0021A2D2E0|nr:hypothetical protein [Streptomyces sp. Je 1-79]MCT4354909.1 hypothetical protein [Streptomyces sp. Je 1-79]